MTKKILETYFTGTETEDNTQQLQDTTHITDSIKDMMFWAGMHIPVEKIQKKIRKEAKNLDILERMIDSVESLRYVTSVTGLFTTLDWNVKPGFSINTSFDNAYMLAEDIPMITPAESTNDGVYIQTVRVLFGFNVSKTIKVMDVYHLMNIISNGFYTFDDAIGMDGAQEATWLVYLYPYSGRPISLHHITTYNLEDNVTSLIKSIRDFLDSVQFSDNPFGTHISYSDVENAMEERFSKLPIYSDKEKNRGFHYDAYKQGMVKQNIDTTSPGVHLGKMEPETLYMLIHLSRKYNKPLYRIFVNVPKFNLESWDTIETDD